MECSNGDELMTIEIVKKKIIYRCNVCHKVFEKIEPKTIQCLVIHPAGTCCHYGEIELDEAKITVA
jgi:hypothetical protein